MEQKSKMRPMRKATIKEKLKRIKKLKRKNRKRDSVENQNKNSGRTSKQKLQERERTKGRKLYLAAAHKHEVEETVPAKKRKLNSKKASSETGIRTSNSDKYYLVRYTEDLITHICSQSEIKFKTINGKTVAFGKFTDDNYYKCEVILESSDFRYILDVLRDVKGRIADVLELERRRDKDDGTYYLVRFIHTKDYYVCHESQITNDENTSETGIVNIVSATASAGAPLGAQVISAGQKHGLLKRLADITKFLILTTPEKSNVRNPLIPLTPRVVLSTRTNLDSQRKRLFTNIENISSIENISNLDCEKVVDNVPSKLVAEDSDDQEEYDQPEPFSVSVGENDSPYVPSDSLSSTSCSSTADEEFDAFLSTDPDTKNSYSDMNNVPYELEDDFINEQPEFLSPVAVEHTAEPTYSEVEEVVDQVSALPTQSEPDSTNTTNKVAACFSIKKTVRKVNACLFCSKLPTRIVRHYKLVHRSNERIAAILAMPTKKESNQSWKELRIEGNFRHNCKVLEIKKGPFITERRHKGETTIDPSQYLPCHSCRCFLKKDSMYKHVKNCDANHRKYKRVQSSGALLLPDSVLDLQLRGPGYKILQETVFPKMNLDEITKVAKTDALILKWGSFYCGKRMEKVSKSYLARVASQNMRKLARLLITIRKLYGSRQTLSNYIDPRKFDDLVDAVNKTCGYSNGIYTSSSLSISLGHLLHACAGILQGEAARERNIENRATEFIDLYNKEYSNLVSAKAYDQLKEERYKKKTTKLLPFAEDILLFTQYLVEKEKALVEELQSQFSYEAWVELGKILLCSVIVFNRKRVGDVQRITLESYQQKSTASVESALYQTLNATEKLVANSFVHFFTRGKKDSLVPVMVPKRQLLSFDVFIKLRKDAGVHDENIYLFGKGVSSYLDGCMALRELSKKCGAKNHQLLRSTALRKHLATMSQVLNMDNGDIDALAGYMGHNIDVHRNFYRLPDQALHLARISRLLTAVSSNNIESLRGKSLEELPVPDVNSTVEFVMPLEFDNDLEEQIAEIEEVSLTTSTADEKARSPVVCSAIQHRPWSNAEREAVMKHLAYLVKDEKVPGKAEAESCIRSEEVLKHRTWKNVKDFVRNATTRAKNAISRASRGESAKL